MSTCSRYSASIGETRPLNDGSSELVRWRTSSSLLSSFFEWASTVGSADDSGTRGSFAPKSHANAPPLFFFSPAYAPLSAIRKPSTLSAPSLALDQRSTASEAYHARTGGRSSAEGAMNALR